MVTKKLLVLIQLTIQRSVLGEKANNVTRWAIWS